jgi:hypothetical protein
MGIMKGIFAGIEFNKACKLLEPVSAAGRAFALLRVWYFRALMKEH